MKNDKKRKILEQFFSKMIQNSKDLDPEFARIVNENYRDLLWNDASLNFPKNKKP